jgi:hypothetical protein
MKQQLFTNFSNINIEQVRDLPAAVANMFELLVEGGEALVVFLASNPIFRSVWELTFLSTHSH